MALSEWDERVLVGLSLAADRRRLEGVARFALSRGGPVAELLRAVASGDWPAWLAAREVVLRLGGDPFAVLDLAVEVGKQELERPVPRNLKPT